MTTLRLLADDLTGALDAGVAFTGTLGAIRIGLGGFGGDTAVADGAVREATAAEATALGAANAQALVAGRPAFVKIDSLLRGPWAALLAGVLGAGGFARCILAPSFPAMGRTTGGGRQWLLHPDGTRACLPVEPLRALAAAGLQAARWQPGMAWPAAAVVLCDAATDAELAAAVAAGSRLPGPTLWCGAGGLAAALAGAAPRRAAPPPGRHLSIIGTQRPETAAQVARLLAARPEVCVPVAGDPVPAAAGVMARTAALATFPMPPDTTPADAAAVIAARLAALTQTVPPPASALVTGGETLAGLCRATGAGGLSILGEWMPGLPVSRLCGGVWDGVTVVSKSGAFGAPDTLLRLWETIGA